MNNDRRGILNVAALFVAVPSVLFGLIFGVSGLAVVLRRELDSIELWLESISYLAMLTGSIVGVTALLRRSFTSGAIAFLFVGAAWVGAAWDRHREKFTEWLLVVAAIAVTVGIGALRSSRHTTRSSPGALDPKSDAE